MPSNKRRRSKGAHESPKGAKRNGCQMTLLQAFKVAERSSSKAEQPLIALQPDVSDSSSPEDLSEACPTTPNKRPAQMSEANTPDKKDTKNTSPQRATHSSTVQWKEPILDSPSESVSLRRIRRERHDGPESEKAKQAVVRVRLVKMAASRRLQKQSSNAEGLGVVAVFVWFSSTLKIEIELESKNFQDGPLWE
eukprot:symbB.v1.2.016778.t1/scaffold1201.1/size131815/10